MATFTGEAGAALAFLILYIVIFCGMLYGFMTQRLKWRSRYALLFFHVTIRVASQGCGLAFGMLGFTNIDVFLAYLILGAEGYFTLVLCTGRFLVSWHQHNLPSRESWLEPRADPNDRKRTLKTLAFIFLGPLSIFLFRDNPMMIFHSILIIANVLIITGGSYLAGADVGESDYAEKMNLAKALRTSGQSIFLAINFLLVIAIIATMRGERKRGATKTHPTLIILLVLWFPLIVRGIFGVLQSAIWDLSYYNPENYERTGFTPRFTALEYVLGVMTEWLACLLLNMTYFTSKNDPSKGDFTAGTVRGSAESVHELARPREP